MFDKLLAAKILKRPIEEINRVLGDHDWNVEVALYLLARAVNPRPTTATLGALRSEVMANGHSMARHGPHLDSDELKLRLTTGYIGGAFAPADKGFATSFTSAVTYNFARVMTVDKVKAALAGTVAFLQPFITKFESDVAKMGTTQGKAYGEAIQQANKSRVELLKQVRTLTIEQLDTNLALLPVAEIRAVSAKGVQSEQKAAHLFEFPERLGLVIQHGVAIGRGMRARSGEAAQGNVQDPRWTDGKKSPIWGDDQIEPMAAITSSYTKFNPEPRTFSATADPETWPMPQHFPDNGASAWRA
jgi:hypothetical protein